MNHATHPGNAFKDIFVLTIGKFNFTTFYALVRCQVFKNLQSQSLTTGDLVRPTISTEIELTLLAVIPSVTQARAKLQKTIIPSPTWVRTLKQMSTVGWL